jgi:hypothetical protein
MNRRRLMQGVPGLLGVGWARSAAQGTPVASPVGTPVALPTTYGDVASEYDQLAERLLEDGRAAVDALLDGEYDALFARFAPSMQSVAGVDTLRALLPSFTTNRVQFEVTEYELIFDAQVTGDTMTGTVQSAALYPFSLQRGAGTPRASPVAGTPAPSVALAGRWTGTTELSNGTVLTLELSFASDGQRGALSIPEQQVTDAPVVDIVFRPEQPIGARLTDRAVPLSPDGQFYWATYDWSGRGLTFTIGTDGSGAISSMQIDPAWQLPPDPSAGLAPLPPLRLPFDGLWWVLWGGETVAENYHAASRQQRHASDIMIWNDGATYHGNPGQNENYWVWGQPVIAPADGTVVAVVDNIAANAPGALPADPSDIAGNHVVLQIGEAAYLFLAHMQEGSITVKQGDTITAGTHVGLAGNSGNSSQPHLHIHVQNEPDITSPTAFGLPITFADLMVDGAAEADPILEQGTFIAPA